MIQITLAEILMRLSLGTDGRIMISIHTLDEKSHISDSRHTLHLGDAVPFILSVCQSFQNRSLWRNSSGGKEDLGHIISLVNFSISQLTLLRQSLNSQILDTSTSSD